MEWIVIGPKKTLLVTKNMGEYEEDMACAMAAINRE